MEKSKVFCGVSEEKGVDWGIARRSWDLKFFFMFCWYFGKICDT